MKKLQTEYSARQKDIRRRLSNCGQSRMNQLQKQKKEDILISTEVVKMEKKYDKWGRELYPLTEQEKPIYDRLMKEYPNDKCQIEHELTNSPEQRDWEMLEWVISL